jgi:NTP pyrophosphatase (non-canonical NTP hydrolase)
LEIEDYEQKIITWARDRGIYDKSTKNAQCKKLIEEVRELCDAIFVNDYEKSLDGVGDCMVVLANIAHFLESDLKTCLSFAWNEIKDRKGKMESGLFVKEKK